MHVLKREVKGSPTKRWAGLTFAADNASAEYDEDNEPAPGCRGPALRSRALSPFVPDRLRGGKAGGPKVPFIFILVAIDHELLSPWAPEH